MLHHDTTKAISLTRKSLWVIGRPSLGLRCYVNNGAHGCNERGHQEPKNKRTASQPLHSMSAYNA